MTRIFFLILKNPLALYIKNTIKNIYICTKNPTLQIQSHVVMSQVSLGRHNKFYSHVILNNLSIGDFSYVATNTIINQASIGKFCSIGPNCLIGPGRHPASMFVSTHPSFYSTFRQCGYSFVNENKFKEYLPVTIGHDVWIGANCIIMDGVKIGNGCIVGANSVVTKDIPDYAIVGGVPAKIIRYRFNQDIISKITKIQWWDWSLDKIRRESPLFDDIEKFLKESY